MGIWTDTDFFDWSISSHAFWKVMHSRHLEYNAIRDNALHNHTQHRSTGWNHCGGQCALSVMFNMIAMPVCDAIITCTISRMLPSVAAVVIIILNEC